MLIKCSIVSIVMLTFFSICNAQESPMTCEDSGIIEVVGYAKVEALPDVAVLEFQATYTDKEAKTARNKVEEMVSALYKKVTTLNIGKDEFISASLNIYPKYRYSEKNKKIFEGYVCTRNVSFKIKDFSLIDKITSMAIESGIKDVNGFYYEIADTEALKRKADALAIADAKDKIKRLAEGFAVKVKKACSLKFDENVGPVYRAKNVNRMMLNASAVTSEVEPVEYTPQKQAVESSVYATFAIE